MRSAHEADVELRGAHVDWNFAALTGHFEGMLDLVDEPLLSRERSGFVARLDGDGGVLWARQLGAMEQGVVELQAVTQHEASVCVGGMLRESEGFDSTLGESGIETGVFVSCFDVETGVPQWSRAFSSHHGVPRGMRLVADPLERLHLLVWGGSFHDLAGDADCTRDGKSCLHLASFDAAGERIGTRSFTLEQSAPLHGLGFELAAGPDGDLALAGQLTAPATIGELQLEPRGEGDGFLVLLDGRQRPAWSRSWRAAGASTRVHVSFSPAGDPVVVGTFQEELELEGQRFAPNERDLFVASWTREGIHRWTRHLAEPGGQLGGVAAEGFEGSLFLAISAQPGTGTLDETLLELDADGIVTDERRLGSGVDVRWIWPGWGDGFFLAGSYGYELVHPGGPEIRLEGEGRQPFLLRSFFSRAGAAD